jgi:hypothetical protein
MEVKTMAKALNFNKVKKSFLPVTFSDEAETTILVGTPTKAIMTELTRLQSDLDDEADLDDLYEVCAQIMSRNKTGYPVTTEFLAERMDFEDIKIFFSAYMEFIGEVIGSKN